MNDITVTELKQKIDQKQDFQLIDVREPHEYELANLGGELIPLGHILEEVERISRTKPVVVQCRSGVRSANAIAQLESLHGFTNLYNLRGGIKAWAAEIDSSKRVD